MGGEDWSFAGLEHATAVVWAAALLRNGKEMHAQSERPAVADQGGRSKLDGGGRKAGRRSTLEVKEFFMSAASVMSEGIGIGEGEYLALGVFYVRPGAVWYEVRVCLSMGFHKVYIVARSVWQYFGGMSVFEN